MNRMEEYQNLMQELNQPIPELDQTLDRARLKLKRQKRVIYPLVNVAAAFVIFVVLVNFCTPVAYACSKVPILRELVEAVTFSKSLSDAIDNEYVQPLYLSQKNNDVTASVEYLIVDQKQVNVFFRLDSDIYTKMYAEPTILSADGKHPNCLYGLYEQDILNGKLQRITIDFLDIDVPDSLHLQLNIRNMSEPSNEIALESNTDVLFVDDASKNQEYIAHFDFLLKFDPAFTTTGKLIPINQTIVLEDNEITFTDMEVYPTHLRVNVADSPDNTAWLKTLYFYIETDRGMKFETISNGITASSSENSPTVTSFRVNSSYFYEAEHLEIVITGAEWLNKDMEKIYVNLKTGETESLPEDVTLQSATQQTKGWMLKFRATQRKPNHNHQLFSFKYYDAEGKEYEINSWQSISDIENENNEISYFSESFTLIDYPYNEVWLCPYYSYVWIADEAITVPVIY